MTNFKSSDYYIIKIKIYASKYLLDKYYNDENKDNKSFPKQHWERAQQYTAFFWELFTHVTGIKPNDWHSKYFFDSRECAFEELQDKYGILSSDAESQRIFLIPKDRKDIFDWIKDNVKLPYNVVTVLKHIPFKFYHDNYGLQNLRQESEEWNKKNVIDKYNLKKDGEK